MDLRLWSIRSPASLKQNPEGRSLSRSLSRSILSPQTDGWESTTGLLGLRSWRTTYHLRLATPVPTLSHQLFISPRGCTDHLRTGIRQELLGTPFNAQTTHHCPGDVLRTPLPSPSVQRGARHQNGAESRCQEYRGLLFPGTEIIVLEWQDFPLRVHAGTSPLGSLLSRLQCLPASAPTVSRSEALGCKSAAMVLVSVQRNPSASAIGAPYRIWPYRAASSE